VGLAGGDDEVVSLLFQLQIAAFIAQLEVDAAGDLQVRGHVAEQLALEFAHSILWSARGLRTHMLTGV
jgi:hypothetical protein